MGLFSCPFGSIVSVMNESNSPKKQPSQDWHRADIVAALHKAGWSLRQLSVQHGYKPTTLGTALVRPWPKGEGIIAAALGKPPQDIWPSRYTQAGDPNRGRSVKSTPSAAHLKNKMGAAA